MALQAVNDDRKEPITRSTLQTQLTRLESKGWLLSDETGRARLYRSAPSEKGGRGKVLSELKQRFFGGSVQPKSALAKFKHEHR